MNKDAINKRLSLSEIKVIVNRLHGDKQAIHQIYIMMNDENMRISYNAAWIMTHLCKEDKAMYLSRYKDELINLAIGKLRIRRGLLLAILLDLPIEKEPRTDLIIFCMSHIADKSEHDSSRSSMIKLTFRLCRPYPELLHGLQEILELLPPDLPPCIRNARTKVLKQIYKQNKQ